jgi:hypothetical protein
MGSVTVLPLLLALATAPPPTSGWRVVEAVVAVVRNPQGAPPRAVTLTKLTEEARVALVARGAVDAAFRPLDAEALRAALGWLLDETLVADEAARLKLDDVPREALEAELQRFRARFTEPGAYRRFLASAELSEEEVEATLARSLRVRRYLESRVGRAARVADDEVDAYVRGRGLTGGSRGAREAVRAKLEEDRATAQVRELLAELRGRADIRILDPALRARAGEGS